MINKLEAVGIFLCIGVMAFALFIMQIDTKTKALSLVESGTQKASTIDSSGKVNSDKELKTTLADSFDLSGNLNRMVIDDVILGTGSAVKDGDTISVQYVGTFQNGQQFDNSYTKGTPFTFTVGAGRVIKGWDEGVVGMKVGGKRILVIPSDLAYGAQGAGPIPANATLVFAIELIEIK